MSFPKVLEEASVASEGNESGLGLDSTEGVVVGIGRNSDTLIAPNVAVGEEQDLFVRQDSENEDYYGLEYAEDNELPDFEELMSGNHQVSPYPAAQASLPLIPSSPPAPAPPSASPVPATATARVLPSELLPVPTIASNPSATTGFSFVHTTPITYLSQAQVPTMTKGRSKRKSVCNATTDTNNVEAPAAKKARKSKKQRVAEAQASHFDAWYQQDHEQIDPQELIDLVVQIDSHIALTRSAAFNVQQREESENEIRRILHELPYHEGITISVLNSTNAMTGIFDAIRDNAEVFRSDIVDFASELRQRWQRNLSANLFWGLDRERVLRNGKWSIPHWSQNKDWNAIGCHYRGSGVLELGGWWPLNILARRDGAHGADMQGIHSGGPLGALSIILAGGYEDDEDNGDTITYCGQTNSKGKESSGTKAMEQAVGSVVRVIRSSKLPASNPYRPAEGIRYDGTYVVVRSEPAHPDRSYRRIFYLLREPGQEPIRCGDDPGARPTQAELREYRDARARQDMYSKRVTQDLEDMKNDFLEQQNEDTVQDQITQETEKDKDVNNDVDAGADEDAEGEDEH